MSVGVVKDYRDPPPKLLHDPSLPVGPTSLGFISDGTSLSTTGLNVPPEVEPTNFFSVCVLLGVVFRKIVLYLCPNLSLVSITRLLRLA